MGALVAQARCSATGLSLVNVQSHLNQPHCVPHAAELRGV